MIWLLLIPGFFLFTYSWFEYLNIRENYGTVGFNGYSSVKSFKDFLKELKLHSYIILASPLLLTYLLIRKGMR